MTKLIVANWKSHKSLSEAEAWLSSFEKATSLFPATAKVVLCPPFPFLFSLSETLSGIDGVELGVQDLSPFPAGAYTGAISTQNLQGAGVKYAILGHSERRRYFHETHQEVANKVDQALQADIKPIVCVDEQYLVAQSSALSREQMESCIVAYEPLEAIGTGDNQPADEVAEVVEKIQQAFGPVPVIYGGSVAGNNVSEYLAVCDGVLVGGSSLEAETLAAIVQQVGHV